MAPTSMAVVLRVDGDPLLPANELRQAVSGLDPSVAPARIRPLRSLVDEALAPDRFVAVLLSAFAAVALLLAAVGVYGVTSHAVARRTREVAVRLALGADAARVLRGIVRGVLAMTVAGLAIGLAGSVAVGGVLGRFVFGVGPLDPETLAGTAALLGAVALLAAWSPARRAGRADPVRGLRPE
jgi:ABC-type antimicrobial peptide transport system permease subunit